ncbi:hypothetical protein HFO99_13360 [Rhizobium leguminosarum]|uniref:hypothetical protein n=1 Tax=Rhizobium leguminosarum TaxID=384 RepID=UPI001C96880B|nr:hypothetical protein [Rhizobium leguminosarum]MBY5334914.1 hypothetical protein [Rhizobium leguminosarum]
MLDDQQRNFVVDAVKAVLEKFNRSGSAFTPSMVIDAIEEDQRYADDDVWHDEEAPSAVTDAIMQRTEQLVGKRQIVLLEDDPTYKWSFKDATS